MIRFIIISATVLFLYAGQGICEENTTDSYFKRLLEGTYENESERQPNFVKHVDTLYLLKPNGSILKEYKGI